jgi:26S proteasome regulatory subunit N8
MNELSKKVNARERPVGWYHTGPKLRASDIEINEIFRKYCINMCPTLLIVDPLASEDRIGLPFDAFSSIDQLAEEGSTATATASKSSNNQKVFVHLPSVVEAEEAEEIGVEHLLRDVKDNAVTDLSTKITNKLDSLRALQQQLSSIESYLQSVQTGKLPRNPTILYRLQEIFNLLPDVHSPEARKALTVANNDQSMMIFAGSVLRSVIALHELINNKIEDQTTTISANN